MQFYRRNIFESSTEVAFCTISTVEPTLSIVAVCVCVCVRVNEMDRRKESEKNEQNKLNAATIYRFYGNFVNQ